MGLRGFGRFALSICAAAAVLAGCNGGSQSLNPSAATRGVGRSLLARNAATFKTIFYFDEKDGAFPSSSLIAVKGNLYGITPLGGILTCGQSQRGCGTVFEVSPAGKEHVLYRFKGGTDGQNPISRLTVLNGTFYGTTDSGGADGDGTVFGVTMAGKENVLYSFEGGTDSAEPGSLIVVNGTFYGTAQHGGAYGKGTVFSVSPSGEDRVLHNFAGGADGASPDWLTARNGTLYGTTTQGGTYRKGTVFSMTTAGQERVLYSFGSGLDGRYPDDLLALDGIFYGTTADGGDGPVNFDCPRHFACGTVFTVTSSGAEKVLYNVQDDSDSANPNGLTVLNGILYGTATSGGRAGLGTVFSVTTSGQEHVLYSFGGDSYRPEAGLTALNGTLFGTTELGGKGCGSVDGCGSVFALTP